jgi:hypothetical protein
MADHFIALNRGVQGQAERLHHGHGIERWRWHRASHSRRRGLEQEGRAERAQRLSSFHRDAPWVAAAGVDVKL